MQFIDTHAHIYSDKFEADRDKMLARTFAAGVSKVLMPNIDSESIGGMLDLELEYPQHCSPMMGLHPCSVGLDFEKELQIVESWLSKRSFIAVGEMGIDLYWDKTFLAQQKEVFRIQAAWAKNYGLPLVIHAREAMPEVIELLEELTDNQLFGVLHCFTGSVSEAQNLVAMNFKLGIGGIVTYKNGGLEPVLRAIGLEHLVLETDSPYLAPIPHRGKRNETSYIPIIAQKVADIVGLSLEEVARQTTENALMLFKNIKP
jgi:TatD DNase family protein